MKTNPEFCRNLWLELSPYRLVSMPLILVAVFYLAYVVDGYRLAGAVASAALGLFFLIALIWGTKLASEAVMNEIRDHTWDGQRMSVLTPWQLTVGKLCGSTIYPWYGAAICLGVYGLAKLGSSPLPAVKTMLALALTALLAHAVSLLASLIAIRKERRVNKSQTAAILLFGLMAAGPFFNLVLSSTAAVTWYGTPFPGLDFVLCSLVAYALWAVIGVYQVMRTELQMRNAPLAWYGFVLFLMGHLAGFFHGSQTTAGADPAALAAFFVALGAIYFMAFSERKDILTLQALLRLAAGGNPRRFLEGAPRWLLTIPVAMLMGIFLIASARSDVAGATLTTAAFVVASLGFLGRDLGVMLFCNLGTKTRRADMLTVICLALLYGVFPATFAAMKLEHATVLFWPRPEQASLLGCVAALVELLLMAWLVSARWRQRLAEGA